MFLLNLAKLIPFVFYFLKTQRQINAPSIDSYLQPFYAKHNKNLKESTLLKIKNFYSISIHLCCASYKKLYGGKLSDKERELATLTAICTPVIDDFTDDKTLSKEALDKLTSAPYDYEPKTLEEDIAKTSVGILLANVKCPVDFSDSLKQVMQAQHWSMNQMDPTISGDELLKITIEKGARYQILCHHLIDEPLTRQTADALSLLGGMLQLNDDIFDVYIDYKENITTCANTSDDYKVLEQYYTEECKKFVAQARALPCKKQDIEFFIILFSTIMARGIVALRRLNKLQKRLGGGVLPIAQLDRKQLICDMENPMNFLKMLWFAYTIQIKQIN